MMKYFLFIMIFLFAINAFGQAADSLEQHSLKKGVADPVFKKEFSRIISSYAHNFADLKNEDMTTSLFDTIYQVKLNFKEKNNATLTFEKSDINLSISFRLDENGVNKLFDQVNRVLPEGFVYTLEYDALAKISNYTFFKKSGVVENFPEKIYLQVDVNNTATLGILKYR
ncbi:MAG: hypothetical protein ACXVB0_08745 [Mucilaginibacter sp.]